MFTHLLNFPDLPLAGRLQHFLTAWEQIKRDPWVLQVVSGYQTQFLDNPVQERPPVQNPHSQANQIIIDQEVQELLSKGAVHYAQSSPSQEPGFVSSLSVIPKKDGGHRPVINLKPLNSFIPYEHFKMESIHMLKNLLRKGDYMVKIDLKDAYLTMPVWKNLQKYLRFLWKGSLLEFACLPLGQASAPWVFTKLVKPVLSILRQRAIRLIAYLEDMFLMAPLRQLVLQHAASTLNPLEGLGFTVNYLKSALVPSQQMEFLGSLVDSVNLSLSLPRDKIRKIQSNCQLLLENPVTSVRELSKFLGLLSSSIQAVFPAPLHYRYLQQAKNAVLKSKIVRGPSHLRLRGTSGGTVVERQSDSMEWKGSIQTIDRLSDRNRRITSGMGGLLPECFHRRWVGSGRDRLPHKLPGTSGRFTCCEMLYQKQGKSSGSTTDGQHFSSNIYQQDGGNTLTTPVSPCQEPLGLVSQPQPVSEGSIHSWDPECGG